MKHVKVIGGGWYGCHVALSLIEAGHDVTLFERRPLLLDGASGNNQSRLHLGFHYPRDQRTRWSSQQGHARFMQAYPHLTRRIGTNVYAVADDSLVDFKTYLAALSNVPWMQLADLAQLGLERVEGAVLTQERLILVDAARDHFTEQLASSVELDHSTSPDIGGFDAVVDCTFGAFGCDGVERYEACLMHELRPRVSGLADVALTVMDGPFFSLYPSWHDGLVTLTSVQHTPARHFDNQATALEWLDQLREPALRHNFKLMGELAQRFLPEFPQMYEYVATRKAVRARPFSMADARNLAVTSSGSVITVRPGKIDAIFAAADQVREMLR